MPAVISELDGIPGEAIERVRLAILDLKLKGEKLTVNAVRKAARVDQRRVGPVLRAFKANQLPPIGEPWSDAPKTNHIRVNADKGGESRGSSGSGRAEQLADGILAAKTDADRVRLSHEAAALVATGDLAPQQAAQIAKHLDSARNSADKARSVEPPEEDQRNLLLASEDAMQAARALDLIVEDARRERVLAFIAAELRADMAEHPNVDSGGAA